MKWRDLMCGEVRSDHVGAQDVEGQVLLLCREGDPAGVHPSRQYAGMP